MANSWEEAFNTMPSKNEIDADIKRRQREIKQEGWNSALPGISDPIDADSEIEKISILLEDFKQDKEPLHKAVERLLNVYSRLEIQHNKVQQAMSIL